MSNTIEPNLATQRAPEAAPAELNEFESLLQQEFKPKTAHARQAVEVAVRTLAEQALAGTQLISQDAVTSIQAFPLRREKTTAPGCSTPLRTTSSVRLPVSGTVTTRGVEYSRTLLLSGSGGGRTA